MYSDKKHSWSVPRSDKKHSWSVPRSDKKHHCLTIETSLDYIVTVKNLIVVVI